MGNPQSLTVQSLAVRSAGLTLACPIPANKSVGCIVEMAMNAVGLRSLLCSKAIAISGIIPMPQGFKVAAPDTVLNLTKMRNLQPSRDVTVGEAMSIGKTDTIPEMPVALGVERTYPKPAVAQFGMHRRDRPFLVDVPPETLFGWHSDVNAGHISPPTSLYTSGDTNVN